MAKQIMVSFEVSGPVLKLIEQRAQQEGINRSEYLRECVFLEFAFSGDLEATKFVVSKVGKRIRDALVDRLAGVDVKRQLEELANA